MRLICQRQHTWKSAELRLPRRWPEKSCSFHTKMAVQPWHELPPKIAGVLRPARRRVRRDDRCSADRPGLLAPDRRRVRAGVRIGVQEALATSWCEIEAGRSVHVPMCMSILAAARCAPATPRLAAQRLSIGARVAWRRFAAVGVQAGLEPDTLYPRPSRCSPTSTCTRRVGRGTRARAGRPPARPSSAGAGWWRCWSASRPPRRAAGRGRLGPLPRRLAVLAIAGPGRDRVVTRLPSGVIAETIGEVLVAVMPDPDGPGRRAAVAPWPTPTLSPGSDRRWSGAALR